MTTVAEVTVLRNMPRQQQLAALRRMMETHKHRIALCEDQNRRILYEINRLKRQDAEDVGHVMVGLSR